MKREGVIVASPDDSTVACSHETDGALQHSCTRVGAAPSRIECENKLLHAWCCRSLLLAISRTHLHLYPHSRWRQKKLTVRLGTIAAGELRGQEEESSTSLKEMMRWDCPWPYIDSDEIVSWSYTCHGHLPDKVVHAVERWFLFWFSPFDFALRLYSWKQ